MSSSPDENGYYKVYPIKSIDAILKNYIKEESSQIVAETRVLNFLQKEASEYNSFTRDSIMKFAKVKYGMIQPVLTSLLSQKLIKIVDFTTDAHIAPCYQISSGPKEEANIIEQGDLPTYNYLNLMSVNKFKSQYKLRGVKPSILLDWLRITNCEVYYVHTSNGYIECYKLEDINEKLSYLSPSKLKKNTPKKQVEYTINEVSNEINTKNNSESIVHRMFKFITNNFSLLTNAKNEGNISKSGVELIEF